MNAIRIGLALLCIGGVAVAQDARTRADELLKAAGRSDGLCVLADTADAALAVAIARNSCFIVEVLHDDADTVAAMRKTIADQGLSGRVSARESASSSGRLPYAEDLVNLLVVGSNVAEAEAMRVLAPYGKAFRGGKCVHKPFPETMDEWTHFRNKAEGNMVSQDTVVGPPRHVRWVTGPIFQRSHALTPGTTALVGAAGRIFYIQDESPIGFAGLPDQWRLVARDAFNGKTLWKRDMGPWGDTAWSWWTGGHGARSNHPYHVNKRLVASEDRVFVTLGYNAPVSALDPATGQTLAQYKGTKYADEIVYTRGVLYVSVNDREQKPAPGIGFSTRATQTNTSEKTVWAIEPISGRVLWKARPYTGVSDRGDRLQSMKQLLLVASEKGVFLVADGGAVVGLDPETGKERFRTALKVSGKTSMLYHNGLLLIGDKGALTAIDAETGKPTWQRARFSTIGHIETPEVFGIGDRVWIGDSVKMEITALDLATGEEVAKRSIKDVIDRAGHHHRCYPNRSTVKYMITGRRGAEFTDYETGEISLNHWARGECRYGHMLANGLLYKLPDPCTCHMTGKLFGFYALASEQTAEAFFKDGGPADNPLCRGKAFGAVPDERFSPASCWPTFRHDAMRSGSVKTSVPDAAKTLWTAKVGSTPTPPVVAGGRVYVSAIDEHTVLAFDEKSGRKLWTYPASGRVDSPPTVCGGMVLFGSADGWVYCLRAADGELVWRFRAAPYPRYIMDRDRVASAWPVHGSVLVSGGVAYVVAGRSAFVDGGLYLYALDVATGRVLGRNAIHEVQKHNRFADNKPKTMPEDAMGATSDILVTDGNGVYSLYRKLDFGVPLKVAKDDYVFPDADCLNPQSSFFDDFWFHRLAWRYGRTGGNMIAFEEHNVYSVNMYKTPGSGQHKVYVPRGGDTTMIPDKDKLAGKDTGIGHPPEIETDGMRLKKTGKTGAWQTDTFPIAPLTMVVADNAFLVAGFVNEAGSADPWANIEGRKGGALWVLAKEGGKKRAEYHLEALPVWNGMAAANGRTFVSLKNGTLVCMGE